MERVRIAATRVQDGYTFKIVEGLEALEKSLGRKVYDTGIHISDDTIADFPVDLLNQIRLMFWLEDERGLDWEIVEEPTDRVLRSSRVTRGPRNNEQRREAFLARLSTQLRTRGLEYVSATFGRGRGNRPVWKVTLHTPDGGVQTERVELAPGTEPFADATCDEVAARVIAEAA